MGIELLPCPFCGGTGEVDVVPGWDGVYGELPSASKGHVYCITCDARGPEAFAHPVDCNDAQGECHDLAVQSWNTRSVSSDPDLDDAATEDSDGD